MKRTRHAKEQKELAEIHQREIEILRNKCLNDVRDDRHDERERIIRDHQMRMMELSTVDDDSYDEKAAEAEKQFNQLIESFDNETENLAAQQATGMIEGRKMEQSGESVGLLERQMSEIQQAIQDCSVDEQIKYEREKMAKKQQKQLKKIQEEQSTKKAATEKTELEKQEAKYRKKKERLEAEMRKEKELLESKDEAARKKLEDAIKRQQERDELNQQRQRQEILNNESDKSKQAKLLADLEENSKKLEAERKAASDKSRSELERRIAERRQNEANKQKKEKEIFETKEKEKIKAKTETKSEKPDEEITEDAKSAAIVNQATKVPEDEAAKSLPNYSTLLLESGIVGDLDYVNKVLKSAVSSEENPDAMHLVEAFKVDDESLASVSSGAVKIVNPRELAAKEFVTFRFCLRQMQELQEVFKFEDIRVFISENLPENDNVHQMKKIYVFKDGLCLIHREALKSVGIVSIIAAHLGSHLATGCTFNDTDTLFKRAFYRSLVLLNSTIPQVTNRDCDFDERSKTIRLEKFKKKLRNLPLNFKHLEAEDEARKDLDQNLEKIAKKVKIENLDEGTKMGSQEVKLTNQAEFEKNELFDSLMKDLLIAMEAGDQASINLIQQQIDNFEF